MGESQDTSPPFLTLALAGGEWSASSPDFLNPGKRPQSWSGHWVVEKNLLTPAGIEPQPSSSEPIIILTALLVRVRKSFNKIYRSRKPRLWSQGSAGLTT
jgi:hypothetical protein